MRWIIYIYCCYYYYYHILEHNMTIQPIIKSNHLFRLSCNSAVHVPCILVSFDSTLSLTLLLVFLPSASLRYLACLIIWLGFWFLISTDRDVPLMNSPTMKGWWPLLRTIDVSNWGLTLENVGRNFSINSLFNCELCEQGGGGGSGVRSNLPTVGDGKWGTLGKKYSLYDMIMLTWLLYYFPQSHSK